jgi:hypothetical protein
MSTPAEILSTVCSMIEDSLMEGSAMDIESFQSFSEAGLMSYNDGVVLFCKGGRKYTMTISEA